MSRYETIHKWDCRFIRLAQIVASWSKDPSTQVGCVIVDQQRRIVGTGYNGFARGVKDTKERYIAKELKYEFVVHAEVNAILNAVKSVEGCTLYCTFAPCPRCASVIIQSGIKKVIRLPNLSDDRYEESRKMAEQMFKEAEVEFITLRM